MKPSKPDFGDRLQHTIGVFTPEMQRQVERERNLYEVAQKRTSAQHQIVHLICSLLQSGESLPEALRLAQLAMVEAEQIAAALYPLPPEEKSS